MSSARRFAAVAALDLGRTLRRPMIWTLLAVLAFLAWGMSTGSMTITSGAATVGGKKAWITSEFSNAFMLSMLATLLYGFFAVTVAGHAVRDDEEAGVSELLAASPLTAGEYAWGKAAAALAAFGVVLAVHLGLAALFNHVVPNPGAVDVRGPFALANYLRPALAFAVPPLVFLVGTGFWLGARSRQAATVFLLPMAVMLVCGFFLWSWTPSWLPLPIDRLLMLVDPAGVRWLSQTWLSVDRGADFYNTARIGLDAPFVLSRLAFAGIGVGAIALAHRRLTRTLRQGQQRESGAPRRRFGGFRRRAAAVAAPAPAAVEAPPLTAMTAKPPGILAAARAVAGGELAALARHPGVYLFAFFVLAQTLGTTLLALGAFDTPLLLTPGQLAASAFNTLSLLTCLLVMFFFVEALAADGAARVAPLVSSSPASTAGLLAGRMAAHLALAALVVAAAFAGCAIALALQGTVPLALGPFVLLWGALLVPTLLAWTAFLAAVYAFAGNRYLAFGVGLGAITTTLYRQFTGEMNWVGNWLLWGAVRWSDLSLLEIDRKALLLNRGFVVALAALFFFLAVRFQPRRRADEVGRLARLAPRRLARAGLRLAPWAAAPLVLGSMLWFAVAYGAGGETAEKDGKDYWKQNFETWREAKQPALAEVDVALDLQPQAGSLFSKGTFHMTNPHAEPLPRFALTGGRHWQEVAWTLDGATYAPDDRSGLYVFTPPAPVPPGGRVDVGFSFHGRFPEGASKNGGGASEFVLPSAVVLTSFTPSFVPVVGFVESIGRDEDNATDPAERDPLYHLEEVPPALGTGRPFAVRMTVTAPADFTVNGVGTLEKSWQSGATTTSVWASEVPVRFFNVVAGRWDEKRGAEGTAIFHAPGHAYNVETMAATLDAARRGYSEWFYPYPWKELKISEFPNLASYAQGFPTNITFSEGIGFLTKPADKADAVRVVTAHEAAHQWWGNLLTPGRGPGGVVLAEGMAHYSTLLLIEKERGEHARRELARRLESHYAEGRRADAERPLVALDMSQPGDREATYDKGGWVAWMLMEHLGREAMLAGLHEFIEKYKDGPDYPLIEDLIETLRPRAADAEAYDRFVDQWFLQVVIPEFRLEAPLAQRRPDGSHRVTATLHNAGTGTVTIDVAAVAGEPFDEQGKPKSDYREARTTMTLGPGEKLPVDLLTDFDPDRLVVDPEVRVLQLERAKAVAAV